MTPVASPMLLVTIIQLPLLLSLISCYGFSTAAYIADLQSTSSLISSMTVQHACLSGRTNLV